MFFKKNSKSESSDLKMSTSIETVTKQAEVDASPNSNILSNSIEEISKNSEEIASVHSLISSSFDKLSSFNNNKENNVSETLSMLNDLATNINTLSEKIKMVHESIENGNSLADNGLKSIETLHSSLSEFESIFKTSSSIVNDMVSKIESVNLITDSISEIAGQTNLLAF